MLCELLTKGEYRKSWENLFIRNIGQGAIGLAQESVSFSQKITPMGKARRMW